MVKPGDGYNPWKTLEKFLIGLFIAFIPVAITYWIEFLQGEECPAELLPYVPLIVGVLLAIQNLIKHWNDKKSPNEE